ncbi:homeodomain-like protein [Tanacetum coccineum]
MPRTPQQNGVVERQNRTLVEAAWTMLIFSKAPIGNLGKLQPRADIGIFIGYAPSRKGPSVSISFDLDAPSGSHISSLLDHHSSSVHHGVAGEQYAEVNPFAAADPEPFVNVFALDPTSQASSSGEIMMPEPNQSTQPHEHIQKWTDSHPFDNIIRNPSRPVSTRKQLAMDALCIEQFLNNFANHPNETNMNDLESDGESVDTPLVSPFPRSYNDSDDGEVLNELIEYENVGMLCREKAINSFDEDDLAFQCMIGFRKFVTYFDPFFLINIITRKAYNNIMVEEFESTRKNLVAIVKDVYVFVDNFTYITDSVVLQDI